MADARRALEEGVGVERARELAGDLQQVLHSLTAAASQPVHATGGDEDDVVDAEYEE